MVNDAELDSHAEKFTHFLNVAAQLPGVRINRSAYLRTALNRRCSDAQIERAIELGPSAAGVPASVIAAVAKTSITYETSKVTGLSAVAGLPGGIAMVGTVPADMAQFMGHILRIAQKLAYLYDWPELFGEGRSEMDEETESVLVLFVGVMFGVQAAQRGVTKVAQMMAANALKKLPQKALMKGIIYPLVKKVASQLGFKMTRQIFAKGVAKAIPIVGAVLSGGLTLGSFLPMARRLQNHLASVELAKPAEGSTPSSSGPGAESLNEIVIDVEYVDDEENDTTSSQRDQTNN